jgi:hypothetical protein
MGPLTYPPSFKLFVIGIVIAPFSVFCMILQNFSVHMTAFTDQFITEILQRKINKCSETAVAYRPLSNGYDFN